MKLENVIKLIDVGYTKEEIEAMENQQQPESKQPESKQPESKQPESKQPESKPDDNDISKILSDIVKKQTEEFKEILKSIQKANVDDAEQPEQKTVEEVVTSFLGGL